MSEDDKELLVGFRQSEFFGPVVKLMEEILAIESAVLLNKPDTPEMKDALYQSICRYKGALAMKERFEGAVTRVAS